MAHRSIPVSDVVVAVRDGLKHCYFAIADITGEPPNVMYEVGFARTFAKPVILLRRAGTEGTAFDVRAHHIHYTDDLADLQARLHAVVSALSMEQNGTQA